MANNKQRKRPKLLVIREMHIKSQLPITRQLLEWLKQQNKNPNNAKSLKECVPT